MAIDNPLAMVERAEKIEALVGELRGRISTDIESDMYPLSAWVDELSDHVMALAELVRCVAANMPTGAG